MYSFMNLKQYFYTFFQTKKKEIFNSKRKIKFITVVNIFKFVNFNMT